MSGRSIKIAGVVLAILAFYGLQYVGTAIHYGCADPKEDCPPPIYGVGQLIYTIVHPPWLRTE